MKDLRKNFERFCLKNRDRGIPNLMLVIAIGNLIAYALSVIFRALAQRGKREANSPKDAA